MTPTAFARLGNWQGQSLQQLFKGAAVVISCVLWLCVSSSAILINKHILVDFQFPYPVTVAWLGLLTTTIASAVVVRLTIPPQKRVLLSTRAFLTRAMPTGFCMALTFQTGNMAYLYLTVAFIQMLKAFCPVFTMVLLFMARLEKPTPQLIGTVVVISTGVALASWGEMNLSMFGLASMLTSVVAESVRLVLTQHLVAVWELSPMLRTQAFSKMAAHPLHFLLAAVAGFGVNLLAILVIKLASSLTLKVLGTVKDAMLVTVGVVFMHEKVSRLQLYGYACSVTGFAMYNWLKMKSNPADSHPGGKSLLPVRESKAA